MSELVYCNYCGNYAECKPHLNNAIETWYCVQCEGKTNERL